VPPLVPPPAVCQVDQENRQEHAETVDQPEYHSAAMIAKNFFLAKDIARISA
jgi:hypothetical protein